MSTIKRKFTGNSYIFEHGSREFPQALKARIAEALWRTCLARAEETDDRREALGLGPQSDSSQEIYTSPRGKALPPFPANKMLRGRRLSHAAS